MIKIKPSEATILNFQVDVEGSDKSPIPRLVIPISDKGISLVFEGTLKDGEVEVDVSELLELTDSKSFKGSLEVIVDDSIFYPWTDTIIIEAETKVKAKNIKKVIKESKVSVKARTKKEIVEDDVMVVKKKLGDIFGEKL